MHVLAMNGRRHRFDISVTDRLVRSRQFVGTAVVFGLLLAVFKSDVNGVYLTLMQRLAFWAVNIVYAVAMWWGIIHVLARRFWPRWPNTPVPNFAVYGTVVVAQIWLSGAIMQWLTGNVVFWESIALSDFLRNLTIAAIFELMIVSLILPAQLEEMEGVEASGKDGADVSAPSPALAGASAFAPVTAGQIELHNRTIAVDGLIMIKSAENYLEFVMHEGTELLRASLREVTEQLSPTQGVVPHRSYWVPRHSITGTIRENGNLFLELINGSRVPVARKRKSEVTEWLADFMPDL